MDKKIIRNSVRLPKLNENEFKVRPATIKDYQIVHELCVLEAKRYCRLHGFALTYKKESFRIFDVAPTRLQIKKIIEESGQMLSVIEHKNRRVVGFIYGYLISPADRGKKYDTSTYSAYIEKLLILENFRCNSLANRLIQSFKYWVMVRLEESKDGCCFKSDVKWHSLF